MSNPSLTSSGAWVLVGSGCRLHSFVQVLMMATSDHYHHFSSQPPFFSPSSSSSYPCVKEGINDILFRFRWMVATDFILLQQSWHVKVSLFKAPPGGDENVAL